MLRAMNAKQIQRAKSARKLGIALIAAGVLAAVWLVVASFHPMVPSFSIDTLEPLRRVPWMPHPTTILFALASIASMWIGATMVARQNAVFEAHKRETEDRLRRVSEYGAHDGRIEPYIGSDVSLFEDKEPR